MMPMKQARVIPSSTQRLSVLPLLAVLIGAPLATACVASTTEEATPGTTQDALGYETALASCLDQSEQIQVLYTADPDRTLKRLGPNNVSGGWSSKTALGTHVDTARLGLNRNQDGRLEAVYIGTDDVLYHNYEWPSAGAGWHGEDKLDQAYNTAKELVVASNADGRLEAFYVGTDDVLYHNFQWPQANGPWSGEALLLPLGSMGVKQKGSNLVVTQRADGMLDVFFMDAGGIKVTSQQASGTWSTPVQLPINSSALQSFAVERNANDQYVLAFVEQTAGWFGTSIYVTQQLANGGWTTPTWVAGTSDLLVQVSLKRNLDKHLDLFFIDTFSSRLYHSWEVAGGWSAAQDFGKLSAYSVTANHDGRLEVFGIGKDRKPYHSWQVAPNGSWSTLQSF
jgi:hypothetical protein